MKTAEEFLRDAHRKLSEPNPADWNQFDEIMKDEQGPAMIEAMKAYAEQFIDAAVTECNKRSHYFLLIPGHSVEATTMIGAGEAILKLKEQLK